MAPWEIWVSESQERMMLAVSDANLDEVLAIAAKWDVEATVIGKATREERIRVFWRDTLVLDMDLPFIYEGPVYERPKSPRRIATVDEAPPEAKDYTKTLERILASPNVASKELVIRQYDHEVRGRTAVKPLQGRVGRYGPGDATVMKPLDESWRGLAVTTDVNPYVTELDPYWGTACAVEESLRNLASVGARLDSLTDSLNFGNPERPERMWEIEESARALGDAARGLSIPFASGNVSLYNESHLGSVPPSPAILAVGIVKDVRHVATTDLKETGNTLFLVGETKAEMGGSEYYRVAGGSGGTVPRVAWPASKRAADAVVSAIEKGLVRACHDVSTGGLLACVSEMAMGGDLGGKIALPGTLRPDVELFSESNTRWVIETDAPRKLEAHFKGKAPVHRLGRVGGKAVVATAGRRTLAKIPVAKAREIWSTAIPRMVIG